MSDQKGTRISLPIGEIARQQLGKLFPHLTSEQVEAIKAGQPVPPSPDWVGDASVTQVTELKAELTNTQAILRQKIRMQGILNVLCSLHDGPKVSAILVFSDARRIRLARKAVRQFLAQTYKHKELLIVNASGKQITDHVSPEVIEIPWPADRTLSLGAMRNVAIEAASSDMLYPHWDDDDVYDPCLLSYMMAHHNDDRYEALLLTQQIRADIKNSCAYMHVEPSGIPNTMLVPKTSARYPEQTGSEDVVFWSRFWSLCTKLINNKIWPVNTLKMCVHTGHNVSQRSTFMVDHHSDENFGRVQLTGLEADYMQAAFETFNLHSVFEKK